MSIFASRLASKAKCLSRMRVLLETICLPKKHCSDAFLALPSVVEVSLTLRDKHVDVGLSNLFRILICYDLHR